MRVIGTISHENQARRLSHYLTSQGIANSCETCFEASTSHMSYQIWIHDEDKIQVAQSILEEFQKSPADSRFDAPLPEPTPLPVSEDEEKENRPLLHRFKAHLTHFVIALCALVFFLNTLQEMPLRKEGLSENTFLMTPIQALFMYDLPPVFEELEKIVEKYDLSNENIQQIPPAVQAEIKAANESPYFKGVYNWIVSQIKGEDSLSDSGSLFRKIREGEIWRLFTPCLLHQGLLHILFNMLWVWYLGRPIEERIGFSRTLLLTLFLGVFSNTLQYLMSGPFFIGYSGIVTGLAGFIWMRERKAPWEGYPLNRSTLLFLLFFIGAIFALQLASFIIQVFTTYQFTPNIANTAHISGAILGALFGRLDFFAQRVKK
jgi:GlpG protein